MRKLVLAVAGTALLGIAACSDNKTEGASAPATTETTPPATAPATPPATEPATPPAADPAKPAQ